MTDLICNSAEMQDFLERVLAPLVDDEIYILLLNTRKKYCPVELSRSEEVLDREFIRDYDIDKIMRKIKKISCVEGVYVDRNTLKEVPISCMALYVLLDPRSTLKGYSEFISDINKWMYESFMGESKNLELYRRMDIKLFSAIHKNRSRGLYWIVDMDEKDEEKLNKITGLLDGHIKWISETHGGFHIIVSRNDDTGRIIYQKINGKIENVEILKDAMTPMVGTLQGGFQVKGIRKDLWKDVMIM